MPEIWQGPLEKIDDYRWRIPKSYKPGMRTDGVIYADEKLLKDIRHDRAAEQVANVAFLPGIVSYSMAMPDIHWGYGFAIGGVAATDVSKGGVVSPGGVGFDINCLTADTQIMTEYGYHVSIANLEKDYLRTNLMCIDLGKRKTNNTAIKRYIKIKPDKKIYKLTTNSGLEIKATADHPFWTHDGMVALGRLHIGDKVGVYPFTGVAFRRPNEETIVDVKDIERALKALRKDGAGNAKIQILRHLKERNLLPLKYNSPQLPDIIKIFGYLLGDGTVYFSNKFKKGVSWFWGKESDLKNIRKDVSRFGFTCSKVYTRTRNHSFATRYQDLKFSSVETSCKVTSSSFAVLMMALGMPIGNKARQEFLLPDWIKKAPLWQQRLFLASFFGAEMASPKAFSQHEYNLYCPIISMNKSENTMKSGEDFLQDIASMLLAFGVKVHKISRNLEYVSKKGIVSYRLRLIISSKSEDLINLYTKVGFEYNFHRSFLANVAAQFLRCKETIIAERDEVQKIAINLKRQGYSIQNIYDAIGSKYANERFIERSVYGGRKTSVRVSSNALNFVEFLDEYTAGMGESGMLWDEIVSIDEIKKANFVYDFTVAHQDHNFIANNFVVSNCGVRLVRTNFQLEEIKNKIKDLVYVLFSDIPSGVGSKGDIKVSQREERELLVKGARWAVEKGYGQEEDLTYCEEEGAIAGADPAVISDRAYERGKAQSGTLGSGNHFIEVQVVDQIYDRNVAQIFGVSEGQITIMIHSGSRGFGYQVCDEYTKRMIHCLSKYKINVPDRQLACAPVESNEGKEYISAMRAAANYAWANRQCLMHLVRLSFERVFTKSWQKMGMSLVYDVAHNIAKIETYEIEAENKKLCVHRKGATRALGPNHPALPQKYKPYGQPVIIPGDMGRNSYLLVGTEKAKETFYSTCHGAGRLKSRSEALRTLDANSLLQDLESKGITVKTSNRGTLVEEAPSAYKNVNEVVSVVENAGISKKVCRMRPLGVIKG